MNLNGDFTKNLLYLLCLLQKSKFVIEIFACSGFSMHSLETKTLLKVKFLDIYNFIVSKFIIIYTSPVVPGNI